VTHDGRFYPVEDVRIFPAPAQPGGPPVIVAGRQEPAMQRAALLGDGWMPYLYSPRRYAASVATITECAAEAGRDLSGFEWFTFLFVNADDDGSRARDETAVFLGGTYRQNFSEMLGSVAVAGTFSEVTARLREYVDAGARHLIITPATRTRWRRLVEGLAENVLPAL
jgi:alkanesulfonate monooxygenase SsuD/methylene tetrahydromethanopterin reductase-like flavin-dependent oxidoreductase (luciferase family)